VWRSPCSDEALCATGSASLLSPSHGSIFLCYTIAEYLEPWRNFRRAKVYINNADPLLSIDDISPLGRGNH